MAKNPTADGITAHFADGTSATGDLLIGTDGTGSTVRTLISRRTNTAISATSTKTTISDDCVGSRGRPAACSG